MSSVSQRKALRDVLRAETEEAHNKLHHHSSFAGLLAGTLDREGYILLMQRLHGFYEPLDQTIEEAVRAEQSFPFAYVRRADMLARDLTDLAPPYPVKEYCHGAARIVTPENLGGVLYVIEGAVLGGALINRAVAALLEQGTTAGRGYWAWCRAEGKHRWPKTLGYIEHLHAIGYAIEDLVAGAGDTFRELDDWLAPLDCPPNPANTEFA